MKYKIRQSGKTQKAIEFHISRDVVAGELSRIYGEISKNAALPGFRSGKAPIELIRKRYKKEAEEEAVKNLMGDSFGKALEESKISMLGFPEISDLEFSEEKGMSYKAVLNLKPEVKLKNYKGLNLKRMKKEIGESDVEEQIRKIREANAKFVSKDKNVVPDDYVICDVDCLVEGHIAEKKENVWLYVGDDSFIPGKSLEGLKTGDCRDVQKDLPADYSKKEIAGKKANFHITVKEVKEKVLPEIDQDFLSTMGKFKSVDEFREVIRQSMVRRNDIEEKRDLEGQALKLLDKMATFDVPEFMVERHHRTLVDSARERLKAERVPGEQIKSMEKDFSDRLRPEALREVRAYFILNEIARLEGLEVGAKDLESAFKAAASTTGRPAEEVRKHYEKNDALEDLKQEIKQRKVLDFLIENANVS